MSDKDDMMDRLSEFNGYAPGQLVSMLYNTMQTNKNNVLDIVQIYMLTQVLNEQLRRYIITPRRNMRHDNI